MDLDTGLFHVVLTRFNLPSGGRESKKRQSPNWLRDRFELFEQYCLPSVVGQSDQDFAWFIYFDKNTPEDYKNRALAYEKEFSQISIFWESQIPLSKIQKQIESQAPSSSTTLITTRLDNDDMLHRDFIHGLKNHSRAYIGNAKRQILNYPAGYVLRDDRLYSHSDLSNAFASLLEPLNSELKSVWSCQHVDLNKLAPIHQLDGSAMWVQVVHGKNVSNRVRGRRVDIRNLELGFQLKQSNFKPDSKTSLFIENLFVLPIRYTHEALRTAAKKLVNNLRKGR